VHGHRHGFDKPSRSQSDRRATGFADGGDASAAGGAVPAAEVFDREPGSIRVTVEPDLIGNGDGTALSGRAVLGALWIRAAVAGLGVGMDARDRMFPCAAGV
jgi:hypothetical protein